MNSLHESGALAPTATIGQSMLTTAIAIATAAAVNSTSRPPHDDEEDRGECRLLGPFALVVQGALGGLALLALVYKRWRERPQRPVKIWAFDVSKQVVGSVLLHIANLFMSMFSAGQDPLPSATASYKPNPCSFYILNLGIDTTVGIPVLALLLRILHYGFSQTPLANPPESIQSGNYGHPPRATWWLKQSFIYFLGLIGMKMCVFVFFQLCPWIIKLGEWALKWTEGNEAIQITFVMLLFPLIMNAIQYYIIDGFIKNKAPSDHEPIPNEDERSLNEGTEYIDSQMLNEDDEGDESEALMKASVKETERRQQTPTSKARRFREYDPHRDGETTPIIVASSSSPSRDSTAEDALLSAPLGDKAKDIDRTRHPSSRS
ncbi:MAG: hypothetical protein M1834_008342 [Cirrosporium novae-zelandiae]|nr:MAG: hypothetical protein M1834_008342 [Cirrosporium novae-zelandiae]